MKRLSQTVIGYFLVLLILQCCGSFDGDTNAMEKNKRRIEMGELQVKTEKKDVNENSNKVIVIAKVVEFLEVAESYVLESGLEEYVSGSRVQVIAPEYFQNKQLQILHSDDNNIKEGWKKVGKIVKFSIDEVLFNYEGKECQVIDEKLMNVSFE